MTTDPAAYYHTLESIEKLEGEADLAWGLYQTAMDDLLEFAQSQPGLVQAQAQYCAILRRDALAAFARLEPLYAMRRALIREDRRERELAQERIREFYEAQARISPTGPTRQPRD